MVAELSQSLRASSAREIDARFLVSSRAAGKVSYM
jgi:hypothetical protein